MQTSLGQRAPAVLVSTLPDVHRPANHRFCSSCTTIADPGTPFMVLRDGKLLNLLAPYGNHAGVPIPDAFSTFGE